VLAGCCLFLGDVFIRRVAVNFYWIGSAWNRVRGGSDEKESIVTARLDALQKQKDSLSDSLERKRSSVRFEPTAVDHTDAADFGEQVTESQVKPKTQSANLPESQGASYTERLLEAKRKANK
jgi:hypothetical protein